jgi:hypothetical protein
LRLKKIEQVCMSKTPFLTENKIWACFLIRGDLYEQGVDPTGRPRCLIGKNLVDEQLMFEDALGDFGRAAQKAGEPVSSRLLIVHLQNLSLTVKQRASSVAIEGHGCLLPTRPTAKLNLTYRGVNSASVERPAGSRSSKPILDKG